MPLVEGTDVTSLVEALDRERRAAGIERVEVRAELTGQRVHASVRGVVHELALTAEPEQLFTRFNRSQVQRNITRARREGVHVRLGDRAADLTDVFYRLHLATRRRQGVPVQPRRFFSLLWEQMLAPGHGFVLTASIGGDPAAAAVFLSWGSTLTYKFGASDHRLWRHRPNHLLFWEAIRIGHERGLAKLDFGRTDLENTGLRSFKSGWGALESDLVYSSLGAPPSESSGLVGRALAATIRHSPTWVCRVIGERLYRYAA